MLVAIASSVSSLNENLSLSSSSSLKLSLIMFVPISARSMNATHGAKVEMSHSNCIPARYPMAGIKDWNPPKNIANHNICILLIFGIVNPLVSDTLKASIANATAISNVDTISIFNLQKDSCFFNCLCAHFLYFFYSNCVSFRKKYPVLLFCPV